MNEITCGVLYEDNSGETLVKCPHCGEVSEECNMPDLFYSDSTNTKGLNDQLKLLEELQTFGYNVVTCGNCGKVLILKRLTNKPIDEVVETKTNNSKTHDTIILHVMHDEDILYESFTPFTKENALDLKNTFSKGEQYAKLFEVVLNNLGNLAERLDFKPTNVSEIIIDNSTADDELYIYNKRNKCIASIKVVTAKQAEKDDLDFIKGTGIEKEYRLFDTDTSNYIPLTDDKTWAFRELW